MAATSNDQLRRMIEEQTQLVAAAGTALAQAERAVTQARTLSAAADAHRRADAALVEVELAETELRRLTLQQTTEARNHATRTRRSQPAPTDQAPLFDVC